jgi:branched-chain amino acid transport system permease protein
MHPREWLTALTLFLFLAGLPLVTSGYILNFLLLVFYWIALSGCWNYMSGYTGYIDFGAVTYVGVGSYTAGVLILKAGVPILPAALLAGLATLLLSLLIGWPTLKLRGAYFAIATFALTEALKQVCEEWNSLTGGGSGLTLPGRLDDLIYYRLYLVLAMIIIALTYWTDRSKGGYALRAIYQNEQAAAGIGINTHGVKLKSYGVSAFFVGILGALEATRITYITPVDVFDVHITIKMIIMSLLGGMGTVAGPILGAGIMQILEEILGSRFLNWYLVFMGILIVLAIMFLPRGLSRWGKNRFIDSRQKT